MATWHLEPIRANLHGHFSRDLPPIVQITSGDRVVASVPDAAWYAIQKGSLDGELEKVFERDSEKDAGHCLFGPFAINGAEPGMTLEIKIEKITVAKRGWTSSGGWSHRVHERFGLVDSPEARLHWKLDAEAATGVDQYGHRVKLRPFLGVMGMPTDEPGRLPTPPPRRTGGNLDCKELTDGASLFLPIEVKGGLFSFGDGHAAQGDGEVCVTAIECPMERVELTFTLHPEMRIGCPRARVGESWITFGLDEDLDEAGFKAIEEMLEMIQERFKVDKANALALASVVVDCRVTQIVNGVQGVHAVLTDSAITFTGCNSPSPV